MSAKQLFRLLAIVGLVLPFASVSAQGGTSMPPVVFLHGYLDSGWTWNTAITWLFNNGPFYNTRNPNLPTQTHTISGQASGVVALINGEPTVLNQPMLVGHSMGGLVAREVATQDSATAIISIGSPHQGHPALDYQHSVGYWVTITGLSGLVQVAVENLSHCNQIRWDINGNAVTGPCYTIWEFAGYVSNFINAAEWLRQRYFAAPAVDQLHPLSSFISNFNGAAHVSAEHARERIAVVGRLQDWEINSSLFRALQYEEGPALGLSAELAFIGALSIADGVGIITDAENTDPWYNERIWGGAAVIAAGVAIGGINAWWNDLVGGFPNDGFVPAWTQTYPGSTNLIVKGVAHLEEPENEDFLNVIKLAGDRNRR